MAKIKVYSIPGTDAADLSLRVGVEEKEVSPKTFSQAVRQCMQNWRQGTVGVKTRSEVSFSNRKPWKQKGTGRARAGSLRSPLWRKGGIIFGPQPRVRELKLNKKQKSLVLNNVFFDALKNNLISCFNFEVQGSQPKTKIVSDFLKGTGLACQRLVLFLPFEDTLHYTSFRNIPGVSILFFDQPNVFDLSAAERIVFLKRDVDLFEKMVASWN